MALARRAKALHQQIAAHRGAASASGRALGSDS